MSNRPHPKRAATDPSSPRSWATSDRNGMINNHENMVFQFDWAGTSLINKRILVSPDELDVPQEQLRTVILPPDPPSIINARVENYAIDEESSTNYTTEDGITEYVTEDSAAFATFYVSSGS